MEEECTDILPTPKEEAIIPEAPQTADAVPQEAAEVLQAASLPEAAAPAQEPSVPAQEPSVPLQAPAETAQTGAQQDERLDRKYAKLYRSELEKMPEGDEKDYLLDRVFEKMGYYSRSSQASKRSYQRLSILSIIFNGVIPFIMLFSELESISFIARITVTALSAAAGILTAIAALMNYRELWMQYRVCLEQLKRIVNMYFMRTGDFLGLEENEEKRKAVLFSVCENVMTDEHSQWRGLFNENDKA